MKTIVRGMILASILLVLAAPLFARGAQEVDFLAGFEEALQEEGFSEEQARAIAQAAGSYDWSGMNRVDPVMIARAVVRVDKQDAELGPDENARLALELATGAAELESDGYSRPEVAQVTLQAVNDLQAQIRAWHDGDREEPLGETVRNTVSERTREAAREREARSGRESAGDTPASERVPTETGRGAAGAGGR